MVDKIEEVQAPLEGLIAPSAEHPSGPENQLSEIPPETAKSQSKERKAVASKKKSSKKVSKKTMDSNPSSDSIPEGSDNPPDTCVPAGVSSANTVEAGSISQAESPSKST
ncbi:hypothetical protein TorRG33x02_226150 [Trema orientale]|uniref:Uncharacterized protein n=1 Tax=Trema orientale TaxID=63057 RepID=A0A2P5E7P9_TREOI|nr:hypothetical protein TorRG33x02_226150 [Trema orientale]